MSQKTAVAVVLLSASVAFADAPTTRPAATEQGISVYFSPDGGAAAAVVAQITQAKKTVIVAAYSITHEDIAKAITDAHGRGVKVTVLMDRTQAAGRYSSATFLHNAGVPVFIDATGGLMHHKFAVVDDATLLTGSFNWTKGGDEENAENLLVITGKSKLTKAFSDEFQKQLEKAKPYERPDPP
jgi:phosphatidylserine/phosphatidylglycerophosphate/cardiolipin synthase-like enzyme